jgi:hypothetical protein
MSNEPLLPEDQRRIDVGEIPEADMAKFLKSAQKRARQTQIQEALRCTDDLSLGVYTPDGPSRYLALLNKGEEQIGSFQLIVKSLREMTEKEKAKNQVIFRDGNGDLWIRMEFRKNFLHAYKTSEVMQIEKIHDTTLPIA